MSTDQLRRLENFNRYAKLYPKLIKPINYCEFAILNDDERNLCLTNAENLVRNILTETDKCSLN